MGRRSYIATAAVGADVLVASADDTY